MAGKILWNFRTNPGEQIVTYFFALGFPDSREMEAVTSRILRHFAPTDNNQQIGGGVGNLKYRVLCFDAANKVPPNPEDFKDIFRGKVKKDERLYPRETNGMAGLEEYVITQLSQP